jgi:hypothetical protein
MPCKLKLHSKQLNHLALYMKWIFPNHIKNLDIVYAILMLLHEHLPQNHVITIIVRLFMFLAMDVSEYIINLYMACTRKCFQISIWRRKEILYFHQKFVIVYVINIIIVDCLWRFLHTISTRCVQWVYSCTPLYEMVAWDHIIKRDMCCTPQDASSYAFTQRKD